MLCVEGPLGATHKSGAFEGICGWPRRGKYRKGLGNQSNNTLLSPLGIIEVIHATSMGVSVSCQRGILNVVTPPKVDATDRLEKRLRRTSVSITFGEVD